MEDMPKGRHELDDAPALTAEAPAQHRDHLWVLAVIAVSALIELWGSWLWVASVSGFPHYGHVTTGWVLFVSTEAYWGYALWTWLAGAPGRRSKRFAMWSAIGMFAFSLLGQESGHLLAASGRAVPPVYVVALVTALPLVSLALVAVLVHLRQADREEIEAVARAHAEAAQAAADLRAEADERTALRAALEEERGAHAEAVRVMGENLTAERAARETAEQEAALRIGAVEERDEAVTAQEAARAAAEAAEAARTDAEDRAARAEAKIVSLTRKLGAPAGPKGGRSGGAAPPPDGRTQLDIARAARLKADEILAGNPDISGAALAEACGMKERWGQTYKKQHGERTGAGEADRAEIV